MAKAYIEYPEAGEGRIEITTEFVVQTKQARWDEMMHRVAFGTMTPSQLRDEICG